MNDIQESLALLKTAAEQKAYCQKIEDEASGALLKEIKRILDESAVSSAKLAITGDNWDKLRTIITFSQELTADLLSEVLDELVSYAVEAGYSHGSTCSDDLFWYHLEPTFVFRGKLFSLGYVIWSMASTDASELWIELSNTVVLVGSGHDFTRYVWDKLPYEAKQVVFTKYKQKNN